MLTRGEEEEEDIRRDGGGPRWSAEAPGLPVRVWRPPRYPTSDTLLLLMDREVTEPERQQAVLSHLCLHAAVLMTVWKICRVQLCCDLISLIFA